MSPEDVFSDDDTSPKGDDSITAPDKSEPPTPAGDAFKPGDNNARKAEGFWRKSAQDLFRAAQGKLRDMGLGRETQGDIELVDSDRDKTDKSSPSVKKDDWRKNAQNILNQLKKALQPQRSEASAPTPEKLAPSDQKKCAASLSGSSEGFFAQWRKSSRDVMLRLLGENTSEATSTNQNDNEKYAGFWTKWRASSRDALKRLIGDVQSDTPPPAPSAKQDAIQPAARLDNEQSTTKAAANIAHQWREMLNATDEREGHTGNASPGPRPGEGVQSAAALKALLDRQKQADTVLSAEAVLQPGSTLQKGDDSGTMTAAEQQRNARAVDAYVKGVVSLAGEPISIPDILKKTPQEYVARVVTELVVSRPDVAICVDTFLTQMTPTARQETLRCMAEKYPIENMLKIISQLAPGANKTAAADALIGASGGLGNFLDRIPVAQTGGIIKLLALSGRAVEELLRVTSSNKDSDARMGKAIEGLLQTSDMTQATLLSEISDLKLKELVQKNLPKKKG